MSLQTFGKGALRVAKNYTKGYSDVQAKVREATSNDPWGPSGTQMNEIAQMTYNQNDFVEIMEMLDKRLNDKGKNWRHVFKCLTVLDYLLHAGSENVVVYFRDNIYIVKTLKEFQYVDEYGKDQGANVRQKAKDITNLLMDEARLRQERRSRANMRDRMLGQAGQDGDNDVAQPPESDENTARRTKTAGEDDMRRAIEESKRSLAAEQARGVEDADLVRAIKLSEEEEARRKATLTDSGSLFDEPSNGLIDLQGQNNGLQPQVAVHPQFTSFNPYQQQAQQEAMQAEWARQQQEWMMQQQQQQQQQQLQLQAQQEEWMRQQLAQQQTAQQQALLAQQQQEFLVAQAQHQARIVPQPTAFGSNNPFAIAVPSTSPASSPQPPVQTPLSNFSLPSTYESHEPLPRNDYMPSSQPAGAPSPQSAAKRSQTRTDQEHAHLASLFAARDGEGVDTFGNVGALRFGQTEYGKLAAQKTGVESQTKYNPFAQQQQAQNNEQPFFTI
ncbi:ENTH-domain-containing protein [Russula earlei]|uniref:ENTH-domain-containing protein n=1 Tax=Russula earlei TaxID=71964 RepID=A0ACC0U508_9AGAM|nr:ENTH-domain-containing protein [Russula earlei]